MKVFRRYKPKEVLTFNWSANLAYAVGLITTDGCLSSNGKQIYFTSNDIEQIGNIKLILKFNGKIGFTRNKTSESYRLNICNVQFYDWLVSIGLTPNKSLTIGKLQIPDEYFIDFLRGHLDGDGSITTFTDNYNTFKKSTYVYERLFVRFISASKPHMEWLKETITRLLHVSGRLHETKPNHLGHSMYILKFGKKESLKLLSYVYYSDQIPFLTRKKSIYIKFLDKTIHAS